MSGDAHDAAVIVAQGEDAMVDAANRHLEAEHADPAGVIYTREQILLLTSAQGG